MMPKREPLCACGLSELLTRLKQLQMPCTRPQAVEGAVARARPPACASGAARRWRPGPTRSAPARAPPTRTRHICRVKPTLNPNY